MMKAKLIRATVMLLALIVFVSCELSNDDSRNCSAIIGVPTTAVTGPIAASVNEEINLSVSYKIATACGDFYAFNVVPTTTINEKIITVYNTYDACNCDNVYTTESEPFKFKAAAEGVYTLKFRTTDTTFVTHVVTVE